MVGSKWINFRTQSMEYKPKVHDTEEAYNGLECIHNGHFGFILLLLVGSSQIINDFQTFVFYLIYGITFKTWL